MPKEFLVNKLSESFSKTLCLFVSSQLSCATSSRAVSPLVVPGDFSQPASPYGCLDNSAAKHKMGLRHKACNKRKPASVRHVQYVNTSTYTDTHTTRHIIRWLLILRLCFFWLEDSLAWSQRHSGRLSGTDGADVIANVIASIQRLELKAETDSVDEVLNNSITEALAAHEQQKAEGQIVFFYFKIHAWTSLTVNIKMKSLNLIHVSYSTVVFMYVCDTFTQD